MKRDDMRLVDVGEDALVEALTKGLSVGGDVIAGAGDDCAVIKGDTPGWRLLLKADCVVEGVHFEPSAPPADVGWKAVARAASDFAAMSGIPRYGLVTMVLSPDMSVQRAKSIQGGVARAARRFGISIVGGETSRTAGRGGAVISIALTGEVESRRCVLRSGGRSGDALFVTGRLGGASAGRHLRFQPRIEEARWLTKNFPIHAMMDLSDGLAKDLPRLAKASSAGFELDLETLPRHRGCDIKAALCDGEDYELLFAVSSRTAGRLGERWKRKFPSLPLTRIGRLVGNRKAGSELEGGWDHFRKDSGGVLSKKRRGGSKRRKGG